MHLHYMGIAVLKQRLIVAVVLLVAWPICAEPIGEIELAISLGKNLTESIQGEKDVNLETLTNFPEVERYLESNGCPEFRYQGYTVSTREGDYLYLIASEGGGVIIGRHFKAPLKESNVDTAKFESSTKSCLNLGVPTENVAAMFTTHLQPYPNEYHVLESNLKGIALFVGTSSGMYSIKDGEVELVETQ